MDKFTSYTIAIKDSLKEINESIKEMNNNSLVYKNFMKLPIITNIVNFETKDMYINPMYICAILPCGIDTEKYTSIIMGGHKLDINMPIDELYSKIVNFKGE